MGCSDSSGKAVLHFQTSNKMAAQHFSTVFSAEPSRAGAGEHRSIVVVDVLHPAVCHSTAVPEEPLLPLHLPLG